MKIILLAVAFVLALTPSLAHALPNEPGETYDLSSKRKLWTAVETCKVPNGKSVLQIYAHPSASKVTINGKRARHPQYFNMSNDAGVSVSQGWVITASKVKRPVRVSATGEINGKSWKLNRNVKLSAQKFSYTLFGGVKVCTWPDLA